METFEEFYATGKIRSYGFTNLDLARLGLRDAPSHLASFSFEYSLAQRRHVNAIERNRELGLTFISWGSLGQGVLSGRYDRATVFDKDDRRSRAEYVNFHGARFERNLAIVETMRGLQQRYPGRSLSNIALRWILDTIPGSVVLAGIKRPDQAVDNAGSTGWALDRADIVALSDSADPVIAESSL